MGLSTHILDQVNGQPAAGVRVQVFSDDQILADQLTNDDGRCGELITAEALKLETYKIKFSAGAYLVKSGHIEGAPFFDEIDVTITISDLSRHYHVPLLLSPFGYSTYRGS